jgi:hypothetical protein
MKIKTKTIMVTPEKAIAWLEGNTHNRRLRQSRIEQYAHDMAIGEWKLTHQGIAFDEDGTLVDGQHRLWAVIESNSSIEVNVTWGMPVSTQLVIDDHLPRTATDALRLAFDENITHRGSAILNILVHGFVRGRPSHVALGEGLKKHRAALAFVGSLFSDNRRMLSAAPVQTVVARAYYTVPGDILTSYVKCLMDTEVDGVTTDQKRCAKLLRHFLLFQHSIGTGGRKRVTRVDIYQRTERSLSAFINNDPITRLYPSEVELFPLDGEADLTNKVKQRMRQQIQQRRRNGKAAA